MTNPILTALRACVVRGEHRLSSGAETGVYIDARRAILSPGGKAITERAYAEICSAAIHGGHDPTKMIVAGPVLGGAMLAMGIVSKFWIGGALAVRSAPKGYGTGRLVEGPDTEPGMAAWLVDDVLTTGASLWSAAEALERERGLRVFGATVLVQREPVDLSFPVHALYQMEDLL